MEQLGRNNSRLKALRKRARSRSEGEVVVDGCRLVADLVRWRIPIRELYLSTAHAADQTFEEVISSADKSWLIHESVFDSVATTRTAQGVLAVVDEPTWPDPGPPRGVVLALEEIQDPGNLGAIVRSAAALGADRVILSPGCADPYHPAAVRGSAGSVFRMPVFCNVDFCSLANQVRDRGGQVWAAAMGGADAREWTPKRPVLLMLGAEGRGLSDDSMTRADEIVSIPLDREIESLNVAVAAGVLLARLRESLTPEQRRGSWSRD